MSFNSFPKEKVVEHSREGHEIRMTEGDEKKHTKPESQTSSENDQPREEQPKAELSQDLRAKGEKFEPIDLKKEPHPDSGLPSEIWTIVQSTSANFVPQYFLDVSRNLLENPNLTASHLSRAELSYKSFTDASFNPNAQHPHELAGIIKHLKTEHQPMLIPGGFRGYTLEWTVVRKLIPRNPKLDAPLLQTCHLYTSTEDIKVRNKDGTDKTVKAERYLVIYLPHVSDPEEIPFYHPKVQALAILYTYVPDASIDITPGTLSIYYTLFPTHPMTNRLSRTGLKMLEIIHKHARGRAAGYTKRVHHDVIIAQKPFQETYAYLKGKYAKQLIDDWVEQTPAGKHVFEDLGIAAFLIELWTDMYGRDAVIEDTKTASASANIASDEGIENLQRKNAKAAFPGFVDIGCGNGLLVYILNHEGWPGWGFDARRRKTWDTFGPSFTEKLKAMLLVPEILTAGTSVETGPSNPEENTVTDAPPAHNGVFPTGTFIVSNHADELTPWTPLLAFLSESPFIAIPCCSHDFGGTRFRASAHTKYLPHSVPDPHQTKAKPPSAYASLCSYVSHLTTEVGYVPEKEHLRIPSTRNIAVVGRKREGGTREAMSAEEKLEFTQGIVEKEMGGETSINQVRLMWLRRGAGLVKPGKGGGH